jgi:hypothetical protein
VSTARRWVRRVSGGSEVVSFLDYTAVVEVERRIRSELPLSSRQWIKSTKNPLEIQESVRPGGIFIEQTGKERKESEGVKLMGKGERIKARQGEKRDISDMERNFRASLIHRSDDGGSTHL